MVDSELYILLVANKFSKMETRKDGREEYTQTKRMFRGLAVVKYE
jgi:hypothetical protein